MKRDILALRSLFLLLASAPRSTPTASFPGVYRTGIATGDSDAASGRRSPSHENSQSGTPNVLIKK